MESWELILAGSAMPMKLRDDSRHRNASSAALNHAYKNEGRIDDTMLVQDHLRHHGDQNRTPCREHNIANRIGNGIAKSREVALRLFLDRAKRSGDRPRAGTSTQDNDLSLIHI